MAKAAPKAKQPKRVVLATPFAGIAAGSTLYVATPEIVADYVAKIPPGETRSVERLRRDLAKRNRADATCPVSTAIFLRLVAETSLRKLAGGAARDAVVPFWRVIAPETKIAKRLPVDADWLDAQRMLDAQATKKGTAAAIPLHVR
jgi:hypothetical protein